MTPGINNSGTDSDDLLCKLPELGISAVFQPISEQNLTCIGNIMSLLSVNSQQILISSCWAIDIHHSTSNSEHKKSFIPTTGCISDWSLIINAS